MSCGCDQQPRRMGRLGRLRGLPMAAGSSFSVGLKLVNATSVLSFDPATVINELEGCLYNTGAFESLDFNYQDNLVFEDYLLVRGVTAIQFTEVEDLGNLIAGQLQECVASVGYRSRDRVSYTPPESVRGNPAYGQGQDTSGQNVCPAGQYYAGFFSGCQPVAGNPGGPGILDRILPTGSDSGLLLIGGLALVAILVLKK